MPANYFLNFPYTPCPGKKLGTVSPSFNIKAPFINTFSSPTCKKKNKSGKLLRDLVLIIGHRKKGF
jgi:hypothetical protein